LCTRTLPIIPGGTPVVADANGNIGIFKPVNPMILFYIICIVISDKMIPGM
jgi:hypothetical protein